MSLKDNSRVSELVKKGSSSVEKGEKGYTFYSSNPNDGEITDKLVKPSYNKEELKKAVDLEIDELITATPEQRLDLVPRPIYNEALDQIEDLRETVESQSLEINDLTSEVNELEAVSASLLVDVDSERLVASTAQNQSNTINERYVATVGDFQNALQKATLEAIERVSLEAQVDGLTAQKEALLSQLNAAQQTINARESQIQILEDQLFGKQAQTAKGATESTDGSFTFRVVDVENQAATKIFMSGAHEKNSQGYKNPRWVNGPDIEIYNAKTIGIDSVTFNASEGELRWLQFPASQPIAAGEKRTFKLGVNQNGFNTVEPKRVGINNGRWRGKATDYRGNFAVTVRWTDGTTDTISSITTTFDKQREN